MFEIVKKCPERQRITRQNRLNCSSFAKRSSFPQLLQSVMQWQSPLTQGRGSKLVRDETDAPPMRVAPHAGAWIETGRRGGAMALTIVAPHAGAWIETTANKDLN